MAVPPWPSSLEENDKHCSSLLSAAARRLVATITSSWGGIVDMDFQYSMPPAPVVLKVTWLCYFTYGVPTDFVIVVREGTKCS